MTLQEHIEALAYLRGKHQQDAVRLTIELEACEHVAHGTTRQESYHHPEERRIYRDAYLRALELLHLDEKRPSNEQA